MMYFTEGLKIPKRVYVAWQDRLCRSVNESKCLFLLHKGGHFQAFGFHVVSILLHVSSFTDLISLVCGSLPQYTYSLV